jgi:hypothetical protein
MVAFLLVAAVATLLGRLRTWIKEEEGGTDTKHVSPLPPSS